MATINTNHTDNYRILYIQNWQRCSLHDKSNAGLLESKYESTLHHALRLVNDSGLISNLELSSRGTTKGVFGNYKDTME